MPHTSLKSVAIGEVLTPRELRALRESFTTGNLPEFDCSDVAALFEKVALAFPPGCVQHAFQLARCQFLRARGPNPGTSGLNFAKEHGLWVARRSKSKSTVKRTEMSEEPIYGGC